MGAGKSGRCAAALSRGERTHGERGNRGGAGAVPARGIAGYRRGKLGSREAGGCGGGRANGKEEGAIHGKPSGRGIFGADNFGAKDWGFFGGGGNFRGRLGEHRPAGGIYRAAMRLSRPRPFDGLRAVSRFASSRRSE